ncbi:MAG: glyoxalase/bleomycin resistance/dioxygenase family protein [Micrococcales bacterium]|nr:MAG: glyoxalase/bleomycin resistance/dioxygenase family protein [Micrococcales bacterium]
MSTASVPSSPGLVIASVTVDCTDAARLAGFWAQVLGRQLADGAHQHFAMLAPNGAEPMMMFIAVPDRTPGKNSWHLDLRPAGSADQLESELTRIRGLGAEEIGSYREYGHRWTTFADPEGNRFCVGVEDPQAV